MEEKKYKVPTPVTPEQIAERRNAAPINPEVVGNGVVDDVSLASCVYKNELSRKSLTVHHLQRRLNELGHSIALQDKDGWFGDYTLMAVNEFRSAKGLPESPKIDAETFLAIFDGDFVVRATV